MGLCGKRSEQLWDTIQNRTGFMPVSYTHLDVYKRQTYYILSQKKEIWNGAVGMFDLSAERLRYYEMKVQRGMKKTTAVAEYEDLEEGFNLDILKTPSGAKLADKILCSCGERMMQKKVYSSVFLTGKGFESRDWAEEFMKLLCTKRRVYMEPFVFAKGAAYCAQDCLQPKTSYPSVSYTHLQWAHMVSACSLSGTEISSSIRVLLPSRTSQWTT